MDDLKKLAFESLASQDGWEMYQMLRHVADIKPQVIVEIGVDGGGSLATWKAAFKPRLLIGIDTNERDELKDYTIIYSDSNDPKTVKELKRIIGGAPIDFLFIDGDHTYEAVKKDYQLFAPLVRPGGIIGFHDTNNRGIEGVEVDQFMAELDAMQAYQTADYKAGNGSPGTRLLWQKEF